MQVKIRYSALHTLLIVAVLSMTSLGCMERLDSSTDRGISQNIDVHGHDEHDHGHIEGDDEVHSDVHGDEHDDDDGIHLSLQALKEAGVVVEPLKHRILSSNLELPGTVVPHPEGEGFVGSLVEGRVKEIFVDIGDQVSKGQSLCVIESPTVGEAEAAYISDLADFEFVKSDLERHKILASEGIGSQKELLELQSRLSASSSAVSATERTLHAYGFDEKEISMLGSNQGTGGRITLRSPISGSVINRDARLGMQVTADSDLFHVVNLKNLRVVFDIPEQRIGDVTKGMEVDIISQNGHLNTSEGIIDRLGEMIHHDTRTLTAFVTVDNLSANLRPGAFVTVRIAISNDGHQVLAVPSGAVFKDVHGDNALFVESKPGVYLLREVETGSSVGGWTELTSGASANERVVVKGAFAVKSEANKSELGDGHNH